MTAKLRGVGIEGIVSIVSGGREVKTAQTGSVVSAWVVLMEKEVRVVIALYCNNKS